MEQGLAAGLLLGIFGSLLLNVGKGVQKQKVLVLKQGRKMFSPLYRRDFSIWLTGILMTVAASGFYSASLKFTDKSSLVASLSGIGLVGLLLYAWLVLKERVGFREVFSSALIILGTGMVSYFNQPLAEEQRYNLGHFLWVSLVLALVFGALAGLGVKVVKFWGFAFGLIAGSLIGLAMILGDMALVRSGGSMFRQFQNPFVYLALLSASSALVLTQVAFFKGAAVLVVPTINSFIILTPLLVEYFVFQTRLNLIQYFGAMIIISGILILTTGFKQVFQK